MISLQQLRRAADRRATGWTHRPLAGVPVWPAALLLCTLLIGVQTVGVLQGVNQHRTVLLTLADTTAAINHHSALEWQAISGAFLDAQLRSDLESSRAALNGLRRALADADPPAPGAPPSAPAPSMTGVVQLLGVLTTAIDREFAFVNRGDLVSARGVHDTVVSPTTARLARVIAQVRASREQLARRTLNRASVTLMLMLLSFTLTVMVLSQRLLRGRQRAERLERERQAEREREDRDSLTGLWNRRGLQRRHERVPRGETMAVLMIDLNRLKAINDRGGHAAGDAFLQRVATALLDICGPHGLVARWGGDEFVALLPGVSGAEAHRVMARAVDQLASGEAPSASGEAPFAYGVAHGAAGQPLEQVVTLADAAMYAHKERQQQDLARLGGDARLGPTVEEVTVRLEQLETPHGVLQEGLALVRHLLGFNVSAFMEREGDGFVLRHLDGQLTEATRATFQGALYRHGSGVTARALAQGATVWSNDYAGEADALPVWLALGLRSVIAVPVRCGGHVTGVITLMQLGSWRVVTPQVRLLLETVARRLGHTYDHARAAEDVRGALQAGLLALGVALEERDLETSGHTERVVALSVALGRRLGLQGAALEALRQGASLHDIGKLSIPDAVLLKPGPLTPDEWQVMQQHAVRGHEIARRLRGLMPETLQVIRHHHEKWDGRGYPDKLAGTDIPLAARIFALCDVFDALTHARPYKRAWSVDDAVAELQSQSGAHFDPAVVEAFMALLAEGGEGLGLADAPAPSGQASGALRRVG